MKKTLFLAVLICATCFALIFGCGRGQEGSPAPPESTPSESVAGTWTLVPATETAAAKVTASASGTVDSKPAATETPANVAAVAARVNGQPIPLADYETQVALAEASFNKQGGLASQDAQTKAALRQVRRQVLDWMIDQLLVDQAAARMGVRVAEAQAEAEFAKAKGDDPARFERWLKENGLTEEAFQAKLRSELLGAAVRDAVTANLPGRIDQVHLRHILVGSEKEARDILSQLRTNEDFTRLARQYSLDMGTRETGGDLGFYPRGILSPEIDKVAFNIVVGQVSDVIQTAYGFHIIQVLEREREREVTPEMMIALRQEAFLRWLEGERAQATIEYLVD